MSDYQIIKPICCQTQEKSGKRIPLANLLKSNISFVENKGQLEKIYNIKIPKIGNVKYYTEAFGGSAYFGDGGVGIGFYMNMLDDIESEKNISYYYKTKKGKSLFVYIDHDGKNNEVLLEGLNPVSYTHLTLPTNREV